jgi:hypothetical protein
VQSAMETLKLEVRSRKSEGKVSKVKLLTSPSHF